MACLRPTTCWHAIFPLSEEDTLPACYFSLRVEVETRNSYHRPSRTYNSNSSSGKVMKVYYACFFCYFFEYVIVMCYFAKDFTISLFKILK